MKFNEPAAFITNVMQMHHIYQPVIVMTLLRHYGNCDERTIATAILEHDETQIDFYTKITNDMVGRVLRNDRIETRDEKTRSYHLADFDKLTPQDADELITMCKEM